MRKETAEKNRLISERTLDVVADPKESFVAPNVESPVPYLDFVALPNSLDRLKESAQNYETSMNALYSASQGLRPEVEKSFDGILLKTERALTQSEGLPRRPWFRHQVYAPGAYTEYGVKTLPGVREAIERRDWKEANDQVRILAKMPERFTDETDRTVKSSRQG